MMQSARSFLVVAAGFAVACPAPDDPMVDASASGAADDDGGGSSAAGTTSTTGDATTAADETTGAPEPVCGNGILEGDEECDDGDGNSFEGACIVDCTLATCGDGYVQVGVEECDDGNDDDFDGCTTACIDLALCGDGRLDPGEECDEGGLNDENGSCLPDCTAAACGDGYVQSGVEECDDGNADNDDPCTTLCAVPTCGDGFTQSVLAEVCDDGDADEGDECNGDCMSWGAWTHEFNSGSDLNDVIYDVAFDSNDDIVVVGSTFDVANADDVWLRKLASDGSVQWTQTYHALTVDIGYSVAIGSGDDIFVAGSTITPTDGRDIWVRRYSSGGTGGFIATANGSANNTDEGLGIAVDSAGNVIVTGYVTTATQGQNIWTRKYTAAGTQVWTRTATSGGDFNDQGHGVATDGTDVIVVGYVWAGADQRDIWIRKYDAGGNEQWTRTYDGPAGANDEANDVTVDSLGNIIVVGYEGTAGQGDDLWIRKYDAAGNEQWTQTYNAPQDGTDLGNAVAVDAADEIFVAGSIFRGMLSDNVFLGKYDAAGNEQWTREHNSVGWLSDVGYGVAVDGTGNIAVGGFETRSDIGQARDAWLRYVMQ